MSVEISTNISKKQGYADIYISDDGPGLSEEAAAYSYSWISRENPKPDFRDVKGERHRGIGICSRCAIELGGYLRYASRLDIHSTPPLKRCGTVAILRISLANTPF